MCTDGSRGCATGQGTGKRSSLRKTNQEQHQSWKSFLLHFPLREPVAQGSGERHSKDRGLQQRWLETAKITLCSLKQQGLGNSVSQHFPPLIFVKILFTCTCNPLPFVSRELYVVPGMLETQCSASFKNIFFLNEKILPQSKY